MSASELSRKMDERRGGSIHWRQPTEYDLSKNSDQIAVEHLLDSGAVTAVRDNVELIADDLFTIRHPEKMSEKFAGERQEFVDGVVSQHEAFGRWFYFPWDGQLVRYPTRKDHFDLRTARNKNIVTEEEQRVIGEKTVAAYGLSVGSVIVDTMAMSGIGDKYILGDPDVVTPTNLNRLSASTVDLGESKVDIVAKRLSRIDPYVEQVHERRGFVQGSSPAFLDAHRPDLLIEEVDDFSAKAGLREYAKSRKVPLIMGTDFDRKALVDVEMHNLPGGARPFLGKIKAGMYDAVLGGSVTESQRRKASMDVVGVRELTPRMVGSVMEIGSKIAGMPQLGRIAMLNAVLVSELAEEILLGRVERSGSYRVSLRSALRLRSRESFGEALAIWRRLPGYLRGNSADEA